MSHYRLVKLVYQTYIQAKEQLAIATENHDTKGIDEAAKTLYRYSRVLILEDDFGFGYLDNKNQILTKKSVGYTLCKALVDLPDHWDMLYLQVNATSPTVKHTKRLRKVKSSWCFCAYALNHTMYESLLNCLEKIDNPETVDLLPVDSAISKIQHQHEVYAIYPSVVYCQGGKSQITHRTWDPWQGQAIYPKKWAWFKFG